jgi:hypothetical protein
MPWRSVLIMRFGNKVAALKSVIPVVDVLFTELKRLR